MGRGHPTSRTPSYITELEVMLQAKNERISELESRIEYLCRDDENYEPHLIKQITELETLLATIKAFPDQWRLEYYTNSVKWMTPTMYADKLDAVFKQEQGDE